MRGAIVALARRSVYGWRMSDDSYTPTSALIRRLRDMYELRDQYRHRAGGAHDPLAELLRRFPEPGRK